MEIIKNRKSVRNFTGEEIKEQDLETILNLALRAPTYFNAQLVSLIVIKDKKNIENLSILCGNQSHINKAGAVIVLAIDYYRISTLFNKKPLFMNDIESVIVGSHDVGIMASTIQTLANSLNYGCTMIGGIRINSDKIIEMLDLPKYTFPLLAITIGVPEKEAIEKPLKPRINKKGIIFYEKYDKELATKHIQNYNNELLNYYTENKMPYYREYNAIIEQFFFNNLNAKTNDVLEKQGFKLGE